ncbi:MAG: helix-turn-helix transcriptional regulator [Pirellulaceae bacterium]
MHLLNDWRATTMTWLMMVRKADLSRPKDSKDFLLDLRQLAALLSVSDKTIIRMRERGELPPVVEELRPMLRWRLSDIRKHFGMA